MQTGETGPERSARLPLVACVGQVVMDHTFRVAEAELPPSKVTAREYSTGVGGMAANAAIAVARLGGRAVFFGRVGKDEAGEQLRDVLAAEGVDVCGLVVAEGAQTPLSSIVVDKVGERSIVTYRGSGLPTDPSELPLKWLEEAGSLLCDPRWPEAAERAFAVAGRLGVPSVLDAEKSEARILAQLVPLADHVIFAKQGLGVYSPGQSTEQGLLKALRSGPVTLAAVTSGENGTLWRTPAMPGAALLPAFQVEASNTTGAGDVFHGAYALALAEGQSIKAALRFASAAGALRARDGRTPDRAMVEDMLVGPQPMGEVMPA